MDNPIGAPKKSKGPKIALAIIALLAVAIGLTMYLQGQRPVSNAAPLKVTINSWIGCAPMYIAQEKGLYEQEGVKVEIVRIEDTGARKSAMIANQVDGYVVSVDGFALDSAQGTPGKIVVAIDESSGADGIVAKNSIKALQDVKGKSVAVQPGLPGHFLLMYALKTNGMSYSDVKTIDMDSDKAGAAFAAGKVDVAVTWEPWLTQSEQKGGHKLVTTAQLPGVIVDTMAFTDKAIQDKPEQIKAFVRGWYAALAYMKANPAEAKAIIGKVYQLKDAEIDEYLSGVKFFDGADNKKYFGSQGESAQVFKIFNMAGDVWKSNGIVKDIKPAKGCIDLRFVNQ